MEYKIKNKIEPLDVSRIRFGGEIDSLISRFLEERVKSDFAKNVIYKETFDQFLIRNDDLLPVGSWRGEFWGKWIISAARVAAYDSDEELKDFVHGAALQLISTADEDGYIGTYKNPENVLPCDPETGRRVIGSPCDHNWNVWCRKYTLWGLLEAYMLTDDKQILNACVKFTHQLIDMLDRLGIGIRDCGTFNGLPAGSILKPILILYRLTDEARFFDFAKSIADEWERPDGRIPNLITNALSMTPVHQWYPNPEKWAKAYELMSCLDGLLELYRVSGERKYFDTVANMYELLSEHELGTVFSVGFNDQLAGGAYWENSISEPCDVIHWMRMCYELYTLTGDVKYMNTVERTFYNPFLASFFKDGKWGARGVRSLGRHMVAHGQAKMKHSHCCVNNMPRGMINAAQCFVMREAEVLTVNMYSDFTAECDVASISIFGSYLRDGKVGISVNAKRETRLKLRIPDWSSYALLNGKPAVAKDGYCTVKIDEGEHTIMLEFGMRAVLREMRSAPIRFPSQDFRIRRFCYDNPVTEDMMCFEKRATLLYGPLLLTRSKLVGSPEQDMFSSPTVAGQGYSVKVTPVEREGVSYAFSVSFDNGKTARSFDMCDYASGTNIASYDDMKLFNIFI